MRRVKRILLIACMLILCAGAAPAAWWRHRNAAKPTPKAPAAAAAAEMTLNAIEVGSSPTPQIILRTSGAPAFTSLSPTPDQFVIDLSATAKGTAVTMPLPLPAGVSAVSADEITEMGNRLTRVTLRLTQPATLQATAEGNSIVIALPAPAVAETIKPVEAPPPAVEPVRASPEPVVKSEPVPTVKATVLKKIETSGSGQAMDVQIATNGDASYSAFKLDHPARIVIDMPGIKDKLAKNNIEVKDSLVQRVRAAQFKSEVTRVVIDLSQVVAYNISKSGEKLHVTFGEAARRAAAAAPAPETRIVEAPKPEPAKVPATDVVSQVAPIAENATWKMPQEASQGASAVIHAPDQAPPPQPATRRPITLSSTPQAPAATGSENVFGEAQPLSQVPPLAAGGTRTLTGGERVFNGEPISLNLKDADLKDVLRTFAQLTGLNVAVDPDVNGSVTVDFVDVPWDQALDLILRQNGLSYVLEGNVMRIGRVSRLAEETAASRRLLEEERLNVPLTTAAFKLSYARASDVAGLLKDIASPRARIIVDQRTNQLIISEIPSPYMQTMTNLIQAVDVPNRQVVIEARIVETTQTFLQQYGFNWGFRGTLDPSLGTGTGLVFPSRVDTIGGPFDFGPGNPILSFALSNVLGTFTLDFALNAAESESLARVIAAPRIQTQDNVAATVTAGTQIPFQTRINFTTTVSYVDATLTLSVTPQITEAGTVIMDIAVQKNDPGVTGPNAPGPSIATRKAATKLMVRDGGTAVIAGIYQTNDLDNRTRLPFLWQIPILGNLFKGHDVTSSHQELLIFITPRIVRTS